MSTNKLFLATSIIMLLIILPFMIKSSYYLNLLTEILIFAIVALSLDLILGYTGMVSLGHAAFFGIGAYTAGLISLNITANIFVVLANAMLVAGLAALIIGFLSIKTKGVYFMMLTLAFSQIFYSIAFQWRKFTGGSDGLTGVTRPHLGGFIDILNNDVGFYYLVLAVFLATFFSIKQIIASPFGHTLVGIRENESRMEAIGYNIQRIKLVAFIIAGAFAGLAGGLNSFYIGFVSPHDLYWTTSALFVFMVIVGGVGNFFGPILGAAILLIFTNIVSSYTERWPIVMGLFFVIFVLIGKGGIVGLIKKFKRKIISIN